MKRMWKGSMVGAMCLVMMMSGLMPAAATELPADTATEAPAPGEETPGTEEGTAPEGESESETEEETEAPVTDPASDALKALTEVMPDGVMVGTLDVSGLSGEEILQKVDEYVADVASKSASVAVGEKKDILTLGDLGVHCGNKAEIAAKLTGVTSGSLISQYKYYKDVTVGTDQVKVELVFDNEKLNEAISAIQAQYVTEPVNARLELTDEGFVVHPSKDGYVINFDDIKLQLSNAVANYDGNPIQLEAKYEMTPAQINESVYEGFGALLGSCTTTYVTASPARNKNVERATLNMNGHIILPGETISTLGMISPVTVEGGYDYAGSYLNGQTVQTIGGGICQVATTLYDALLEAQIQITYRKNHSKTVDYVPLGMDATIFPESGLDMTAINSTGHAIYINCYTNGTTLTVNIYGVEYRDPSVKVVYRPELVEHKAMGVIDRADESMKPGTVVYDVVEHEDATARLWKDVYVNGVLSETILMHTDRYQGSPGERRYGPPKDDEGTLYYVRDDGYVVAMEDIGNPDAKTYRLNNDGTFLDDPLEDKKKEEESKKDDDKKDDKKDDKTDDKKDDKKDDGKEEVKQEEPKAEEPKAEEPKAEEPKAEEPKAEEEATPEKSEE